MDTHDTIATLGKMAGNALTNYGQAKTKQKITTNNNFELGKSIRTGEPAPVTSDENAKTNIQESNSYENMRTILGRSK